MLAGIGATVACGNQAKDNRIVLSSQSEADQLIVPSGECEDCIVSKSRLETAIADRLKDVSKVYDLSFDRSFAQMFDMLNGEFTVSFSAQADSGSTYVNIQCEAMAVHTAATVHTFSPYIHLEHCSNKDVKLEDESLVIRP